MSESSNNKPSLKDIAKIPSGWEIVADDTTVAAITSSENFKDAGTGLFAADASIGQKNNDDVARCKICSEKGFPNESILFEKIPGRILSNGTNEVKNYRVLNYTDNSKHEHKDLWKDLAPKLWQQAMEDF